MEIKIKKIGYKVGTVGWFAAGINAGTIRVEEGISKSKKHALYLKTEEDGYKNHYCIAIFNPYDLSLAEWEQAEEYKPLKKDTITEDPMQLVCDLPLTDACLDVIYDIASAWCDNRNAERDADKKQKVTVKFEEAA